MGKSILNIILICFNFTETCKKFAKKFASDQTKTKNGGSNMADGFFYKFSGFSEIVKQGFLGTVNYSIPIISMWIVMPKIQAV